MRKNVGNGDRFLRIILGVIVLIFGLSDSLDGMFKWIALALGLILVITSSMQFCPLYVIFRMNTCKVKGKKK
jgi:hypothetical protein